MNSKLRLTVSMISLLLALAVSNGLAQFEIGQTSTPPTIDGVVDASWDTLAMYVGVDPTTWTPSPDHQSLADCSFKWSAVWDADSLYVIVIIMDDITTTGVLGSGVDSWMNDNVEMSINDPAGSGNSVFFRFGYDRDGEDLGLLDSPPKATPVGSRSATTNSADGWIMEAAIPWSILSNDSVDFSGYPAIDKVLNMNVNVADLDIPEATGWDQLSGHVQWPRGWSATDVTLVATATVDDTPPAAPANVTSSNVTYNSASIGWDASPEADVLGYLVLANDAPKKFVPDPTATGTDLAGLDPETAITISVIAVDAQNLSDATTTDFTTGSTPTPLDLNVHQYAGSYATPFEDFDFMDALEAQPLGYHFGDANTSDLDLAANMKVTWTDAALFMQVNVTDESIQNTSEASPWENDNGEYHFDMGNERDGSSTEDAFENYDPNNFQYRAIPQQAWQTGSTPAPDWTGVAMATYDYYGDGVDAIGYTIEMSWPWSALNASSGLDFVAAVDAAFAFDLKVSDTDEDGSSAQLTWSSFTHNEQYKNDAEFGQFILKGATTGIASSELASTIRLFPNPANTIATVRLSREFNGTVTLNDVTGKAVIQRTIQHFTGDITLDVSKLSKGLYIVTFESLSGERSANKLIIK